VPVSEYDTTTAADARAVEGILSRRESHGGWNPVINRDAYDPQSHKVGGLL
jgi:hypothetical protein